jgi:hypothetical protein
VIAHETFGAVEIVTCPVLFRDTGDFTDVKTSVIAVAEDAVGAADSRVTSAEADGADAGVSASLVAAVPHPASTNTTMQVDAANRFPKSPPLADPTVGASYKRALITPEHEVH